MRNAILAVIILFAVMPGIASSVGIEEISVEYDTENLPSDYINVYINAIGIDKIKEIQLELTYNPTVITPENISTGDLISGGTNVETQKDVGKITFSINNSSGLDGSGSLVKLLFKSIGSVGESSPLDVHLMKVATTENYGINTSTVDVENSEYVVSDEVGTTTEEVNTTAETTTPTGTTTETTTEEVNTTAETTTPTGTTTETTTEEVNTTAETTTPTGTTTETPIKETPGFIALMAISMIVIAAVALYIKRQM